MRWGTCWKPCNSHDWQWLQKLHRSPSEDTTTFKIKTSNVEFQSTSYSCQVVWGFFLERGVVCFRSGGNVLFLNRTDTLCNYLIWSSARKIYTNLSYTTWKELMLSCQLQVLNTFTSLGDKILLFISCQAKHPWVPIFVIKLLKLT